MNAQQMLDVMQRLGWSRDEVLAMDVLAVTTVVIVAIEMGFRP